MILYFFEIVFDFLCFQILTFFYFFDFFLFVFPFLPLVVVVVVGTMMVGTVECLNPICECIVNKL